VGEPPENKRAEPPDQKAIATVPSCKKPSAETKSQPRRGRQMENLGSRRGAPTRSSITRWWRGSSLPDTPPKPVGLPPGLNLAPPRGW